MIRQIIKIDEDKCNGCGACAHACHEGAITMVDGKAKLIRDDYCDGLGDCLPACPTEAISFEQREAIAYDEEAVKKHIESKKKSNITINNSEPVGSELRQWPVQIKLVPVSAPFFNNADMLIAADCTAYAYGNFHNDFIKDHVTVIGCPKLDEGDYADKLTEIFISNEIKSIKVVRMEVPCCGGIENAVKRALNNSGKDISLEVVTIGRNGEIK